MLPPVKVGKVKSGASDGLAGSQLTATPDSASIAMIKAAFIDVLQTILVTSRQKKLEKIV
jgi:hypothetical protein